MARAWFAVSESRMPQRKVYYCQKELLHFIVYIVWLVLINFSIRLHMPSSTTIYIKIWVTCLLPPFLCALFSVSIHDFLLFVHYTKGRACWFCIDHVRVRELRCDKTYTHTTGNRSHFRFHQLFGYIERSAANQQNEVRRAEAALFSFSLFSSVPLTLAVSLIESLSMR